MDLIAENRKRREELYQLLGDLPECTSPPTVVKVGEEERPQYLLEKLVLDLNGLEPVPAYFVRPKNTSGQMPAVLFNHSHWGDYVTGKDEMVYGRKGALQEPPYAEEFARRGYAVLAVDAWGFGERRGRAESEIFKEMLWRGRVMWGMMVYDSLRALDYLANRIEVDAARLATIGMSMGSTTSFWVAALDERIKVCVDICCLSEFQALIETGGMDIHNVYYFVPGLLKRFTAGQINALIAPRAHLSLAGIYDRLTPPAGLEAIDAELRRVYAEHGRPEAWRQLRYPCGHVETAAMRAEILAFLEGNL